MSKRKYVQTQRAESKEETRQRIVEATVALHEEVGPRDTTISAIAERAGVQRLTVYRHFPDEIALFQACTSHWMEGHPPPDPARWAAFAGLERVRAALGLLYAYYRGTDRMLTLSYRDVDDVPALQAPMKKIAAYLDGLRDELTEGLEGGPPGTVPTLGHAVRFSTWKSLKDQGLDDQAMADLVCRWLGGALAAD